MIIKKNCLRALLCFMHVIHTHDNSQNLSSFIETTTLENLNYHECKQARKTQLKSCYKTLTHKERIRLFIELSFEQKEEFLKGITLEEYEEFLDDFNEYDWHKVIKQIPEKARQIWPKTVYEQRMALFALLNQDKKNK